MQASKAGFGVGCLPDLVGPAHSSTGDHTGAMSDDVIDADLSTVDEPQRTTLQAVRERILDVVPDAEEVMAYGAPAFKVEGRLWRASPPTRTI